MYITVTINQKIWQYFINILSSIVISVTFFGMPCGRFKWFSLVYIYKQNLQQINLFQAKLNHLQTDPYTLNARVILDLDSMQVLQKYQINSCLPTLPQITYWIYISLPRFYNLLRTEKTSIFIWKRFLRRQLIGI